MKRDKFHHGDLRAALLQLATRKLAGGPYEDLSLRDLANELSVSQTAPFRHFPNKDALLQTLAIGGVGQLSDAFREAGQSQGAPAQRLRRACCAYLDFAVASPQLFRLIFVSDTYWRATIPATPADVPNTAYGEFEQLVAGALVGGVDPSLAALTCWSTVHGFAMLRLTGRIEMIADLQAATEVVLTSACTGPHMRIGAVPSFA